MALIRKLTKAAGLVGLTALASCARKENPIQQNQQTVKIDTTYVSGLVKGERFQTFFASSSSYTFSLQTPDGLKLINCYGDRDAAEMDALINPGDSVKFRLPLPGDTRLRNYDLHTKEMNLCKENLVEINGRKVKFDY